MNILEKVKFITALLLLLGYIIFCINWEHNHVDSRHFEQTNIDSK